MGDKVFKKKHGGYPHWHKGGPPEIKSFARDARRLALDAIREIKRDGVMLYQGRFGDGGFSDTNGVLVEVWRVDGCDWLVSGVAKLTSWTKVARERGLPDDFLEAKELLGAGEVQKDYSTGNGWRQMGRAERVKFAREARADDVIKARVGATPQTLKKINREDQRRQK